MTDDMSTALCIKKSGTYEEEIEIFCSVCKTVYEKRIQQQQQKILELCWRIPNENCVKLE